MGAHIIRSKEDLVYAIKTAVGEQDVAELIAEVWNRTGKDLVIRVERGGSGDPYEVENLKPPKEALEMPETMFLDLLRTLRAQHDAASSKSERERLRWRIAELVGGVAVIRVNVSSDAEFESKKRLLEKAYRAGVKAVEATARMPKPKEKIPTYAREEIRALKRVIRSGDYYGAISDAFRDLFGRVDLVPALTKALKDKDPEMRASIAEALARVSDYGPDVEIDTVPALIKALTDDYWKVRMNAAWALFEVGSYAKAAVPALIRSLKDENEEVSEASEEALKQITDQDFGRNAQKWRQWWEQNK